jgi:hypothetical protein
MKLKPNFSHLATRLAAVVTAYFMVENVQAQAAGDSLSVVASNVSTNLYQVTDVISTCSYVAGAGLGMAGVLKLKAHAENPGNHSIAAGGGRIAAGAACVALPWVINTAFNSIGTSGNETTGTGISGSTNRL